MTGFQRETLLNELRRAGADFKFQGDELALRCPACAMHHHDKRRTLYLNLKSGKWICFRCEPRRAGTEVNRALLVLFGLERLLVQLEDGLPDIPEGSLTELRQRLLLGQPAKLETSSAIPL